MKSAGKERKMKLGRRRSKAASVNVTAIDFGDKRERIVQDVHAHCLAKATLLSSFQVARALPLFAVIAVLQKAGISFVLVGTYGLSGWINKPRATEDVDVIVAARHHKKAVKALLAAFAHLEEDALLAVTRLRNRETHAVAVDVMKPNQRLFRAAFKHTHSVASEGQSFRIPSLEMALAMKYAPMVSLCWSDPDKYLHAHDFCWMALSNPNIDLEKLAELGDLVYQGGGKEIVEKVRQVRAGEKLNL
jgi:hypothetical protein